VKLVAFVLAAAAVLSAREQSALARDLDGIAKVATVMVDGDICQRIVTPRAMDYMLSNPSPDRWAAADNYDVDPPSFLATKKTLMRLALLADYPVDVNLWMPLKPDRSVIHIVIRNKYEMSQFWPWGKLTQEPVPAMLEVLKTGRRITVTEKPGFVSVLAPVRNSLGNIVGLVEVVSRVEPDTRENVK
jgi:hypothetical protein